MKTPGTTVCLALCCLMLAFIAPAEARSDFVKVKGRHFELDGKPYYFAGANLWYGMYLGSPGATGDRARLTKELDQLAAQGVRICACSRSPNRAR